MNSGVTVLGKRLYGPNLRDATVLENVQSRIFHTFVYNFFPPGKNYNLLLAGKCMKS